MDKVKNVFLIVLVSALLPLGVVHSGEMVSIQDQKINELKDYSKSERFWVEREGDMIREIKMNLTSKDLQAAEETTEETLANEFLKRYSDLLQVPNADKNFELYMKKGTDSKKLFYRQKINGYPVLGGWLKITISGESNQKVITKIYGRYLPNPDAYQLTYKINSDRAKEIIMQAHGIKSIQEFKCAENPSLWVYDKALVEDLEQKHDPELVWKVIFSSPKYNGVMTVVFINAVTGKILKTVPVIDYANFNMYNTNGDSTPSDGVFNYLLGPSSGYPLWFTEAGVVDGISPDEAGNVIYQSVVDYYDFLMENFGRANLSAEMGGFEDLAHSYYINFGGDFSNKAAHQAHFEQNIRGDITSGYNWNHSFAFGSEAATLDTVIHEMTHALYTYETGQPHPLISESTMIAEHLSDAFAHFVGVWTGRDAGWWMFNGRPLGPQRCMSDPGLVTVLWEPDRGYYSVYTTDLGDELADDVAVIGPYPDVYCVSTYSGADCPWDDPHFRSTILSKALYLMVEGGAHRGYEIRRIDREDWEEVVWNMYYRMITEELTAETMMVDFATALIDICEGESSGSSIPPYCCQIRNALASVGVARMDLDCDGTPETFDPEVWVRPGSDPSFPSPYMEVWDNCPELYNPIQEDTDGDGLGDICDDDLDGDTILNGEDNCPTQHNYNQLDFDGDRHGDVCDNCAFISNDTQEDLDGDGDGDACDDDIDNDCVINIYDECQSTHGIFWLNEGARCPTEWASSSCEADCRPYTECPDGYFCNFGCPLLAEIRDIMTEFHFHEAMFGPYPEMPIEIEVPFDLCKFIDCSKLMFGQNKLELHTTIEGVLPKIFNDGKTSFVNIMILDQFGKEVGRGGIELQSKDAGQNISRSTMLSFEAWNMQGQNMSLPYKIKYNFDFGTKENAKLFLDTKFNLKTGFIFSGGQSTVQ